MPTVFLIAFLVVAVESGVTHLTFPAFRGTAASGQTGAQSARAQDTTCVRFSSGGRLRHDAPFAAALPTGLEFRLQPDGDVGWNITVRRRVDATVDYMWVVSPPFQTAPQRKIGPGYGRDARESASVVRHLRFVLTDEDYEAALKIVREDDAGPEKMARLDRLGKGILSVEVGKFGLRNVSSRDGVVTETFDWIEFSGEACVPR
jgi:hypothetical protein